MFTPTWREPANIYTCQIAPRNLDCSRQKIRGMIYVTHPTCPPQYIIRPIGFARLTQTAQKAYISTYASKGWTKAHDSENVRIPVLPFK